MLNDKEIILNQINNKDINSINRIKLYKEKKITFKQYINSLYNDFYGAYDKYD